MDWRHRCLQARGMPNYRRVWVPGRTCFFTVNLLERRRRLLVEHVDLLLDSFRTTRAARPFVLLAWVILPDHLHCVWRLPDGDADNANRWAQIKSGFSRRLPATERRSACRVSRRERGIWQRRYWEHLIRDPDDLRHHLDYIHYNPVKHRHAARVSDWPHSSFHAWVERRTYALDWCGEALLALPVEGRREGRRAGLDPPSGISRIPGAAGRDLPCVKRA